MLWKGQNLRLHDIVNGSQYRILTLGSKRPLAASTPTAATVVTLSTSAETLLESGIFFADLARNWSLHSSCLHGQPVS